jgi:hypothetical protein
MHIKSQDFRKIRLLELDSPFINSPQKAGGFENFSSGQESTMSKFGESSSK